MPEININTDKLPIVKPASFTKSTLKIGDKVKMIVTQPHIENSGMNSIPVNASFNGEIIDANFSINTGNFRKLKTVLGGNSDTYVGASFDAVVVPRNNPQTQTEVLSWSIDETSIKTKA